MHLQSSVKQKIIVAATAFACACAGFSLAGFVLIPVIGSLMLSFGLPALIQQTVILSLLFGFPVIMALAGLNIGALLIGYTGSKNNIGCSF